MLLCELLPPFQKRLIFPIQSLFKYVTRVESNQHIKTKKHSSKNPKKRNNTTKKHGEIKGNEKSRSPF